MQPTTVDVMIRSWKIARLSSDSALGYPRINILARCALYGGGVGLPTYRPFFDRSEAERDAELVQKIVFKMPEEIRFSFEAKHLALLHGKRYPKMPHRDRAKALGVAYNTYKTRYKAGWRHIHNWLDWEFDYLPRLTPESRIMAS